MSASSGSWDSEAYLRSHRVCHICREAKPALNDFPEFSTCQHDRSSCKSCILRHFKCRLRGDHYNCDAFTCPECNKTIPHKEWGEALGPRIRQHLLGYLRYKVFRSVGTLRACPTPDCDYSALVLGFEEGVGQQLRCPKCNGVSCSVHMIPWHDGHECAKYGRSMRRRTSTIEFDRFLLLETRRCPVCQLRVSAPNGCESGECS
jgi:hypothetical protein